MRHKSFFQSTRGFALSGGGARGVAHIGVLKAMTESPHSIDCIAGTSAGSLVAALYAFGKTPLEIQEIFGSLSFTKMGMFRFGSGGLFDGDNIADIVKTHLGEVDIADAKIPLAIVCCDINTGENVVFTEGPLPLLVQASSAFPGLFAPVEYQGMLLVDGFLSENIPISAVKKMGADFIVAVNLSGGANGLPEKPGMIEVLNRSFDILVDKPHKKSSKVSYEISLDITFMDRFRISEIERAVELGYRQTKIMLAKPLIYWSFKPIFDYFSRIFMRSCSLIKSLVSGPHWRIPFWNLQKRWRKLGSMDIEVSPRSEDSKDGV